jgi:radical SAM superfamily enzyme YgiQ (UPF0313 family)
MKQQVIPYLISSHPGSTVVDMAELASTLQKIGYTPEQVQDFTPTPMTLATAIYYTGVSPYTLEPIASAKTIEEKKLQQAFFFFYKPENRMIIKNHLSKIGRNDLIKRIFVPIFLTYLCTLL